MFLATSLSGPSNYPAAEGCCKTTKYMRTHTQKGSNFTYSYRSSKVHFKTVCPLCSTTMHSWLSNSKASVIHSIFHFTLPSRTNLILIQRTNITLWNPAAHYLCLWNNNSAVMTIFLLWPLSALELVRYKHNSYATESIVLADC